MTNATLVWTTVPSVFDPTTELPLKNGTIEFFETDGVTPKTIWEDAEKLSVAANPFTLDNVAFAELFADGVYTIVYKDSSGSVVRTIEKVEFALPDNTFFGIDASTFGPPNDDVAIDAAITSAAGSDTSICLVQGNWPINNNLTIPSNINLKYIHGAFTTVAAGITLTINGTIDATLFNIFRGAGTVVIDDKNNDIPSIWLIGGTHDDRTLNGVVTIQDNLFVTGVVGIPIAIQKNENTANVELFRFDRTSISPADNDSYDINFFHENDNDTQAQYARLKLKVLDATDTTEKGELIFAVADGVDGSIDNVLSISIDGFNNPSGDFKINDNVIIANDLTAGAGTLFVDESLTRVGINNLTPASALDVTGDLIVSGSLTLGSLNVGSGTEGAPSYAFDTDDDTGIYNPSADNIGFSTGGTEKLRIDSTGNIGFGEKTPLANIHITDTDDTELRIVTGADDRATLAFYTDAKVWDIIANPAQTTEDRFGISNASSTELFSILQTGNVGISDTAPSKLLTLKSANNSGILLKNTAGSSRIDISLDGSDNTFIEMFNTSNTSQIKLDSVGDSYLLGGSLGIGISSPTEELHIQGTGAITALIDSTSGVGTLKINSAAANDTVIELQKAGSLQWSIKNDETVGTANDSLIINNGTTNVFSLERDGASFIKVGINEQEPGLRDSRANTLYVVDTNQAGITLQSSTDDAHIIMQGSLAGAKSIIRHDNATADLFIETTDTNAIQIDGTDQNVTIFSGIDLGDEGTFFKVKVISVGNWNMDITSQITVAHGLSDINKVLNVHVRIIKDDSLENFDLIVGVQGTDLRGGARLDATNVILDRQAGGTFDSTDFNAVVFNRGFITIVFAL